MLYRYDVVMGGQWQADDSGEGGGGHTGSGEVLKCVSVTIIITLSYSL